MDRLTAFVAIAHLKLRLQYLNRHPEILEGLDMTPKFKGLASALGQMQHDLEAQAEAMLADIAVTSVDANNAFAKAQQKIVEAKTAVADVKAFIAELEGSNGGPTVGEVQNSPVGGSSG